MSVFLAHAGLTTTQMLALFVTDVLGVLPFCALGLLDGTLLKGQGAPGLLNMIYLPMAFLSGLWFPLQMMPAFLRGLAPIWPSYHLNALALSVVGFDTGARLPHVLVLAGFTVVFLAVAARRLRRHG
jgi:ABC-2 type transport system permease protein